MVENSNKMHRHNFFLEKEVVSALREVAKSQRRTFSEVVRIALEAYVHEQRNRPQ